MGVALLLLLKLRGGGLGLLFHLTGSCDRRWGRRLCEVAMLLRVRRLFSHLLRRNDWYDRSLLWFHWDRQGHLFHLVPPNHLLLPDDGFLHR